MEENKFTESFDISRFIQDEDFESLIQRFENDRTPDKIKQTSTVMSVEDFLKNTKCKEEVKKSNVTRKEK